MARGAVLAVFPRIVVTFFLARSLADAAFLVASGTEVEVHSWRDGESEGGAYTLQVDV